MGAEVIIRATRPLVYAGRRVEAGCTLRVSAREAAELLDSGRAELAHDGDADAVHAARLADVRRAIAQAGRPWGGAQVAPPWQRMH
jgi:hypothetical protein